MIAEEIKKIDSSKKKLREFGWVVGGISLLIGAMLWRKGAAGAWPLLFVGALLAVAGTVCPRTLKPLHKGWMALAIVMGWVMTHVILAVVFFAALVPLALLARAFGKAFLDLKINKSTPTYWLPHRKSTAGPERYERQF